MLSCISALEVRVKAPIIRLSRTDMKGKTRRPSGTMTMPRLTIASGRSPSIRSPGEMNRAGAEPPEACDGAEQRRLAGTVGPDQRYRLALVHLETDALQGMDVVVEQLGICDGEQGCGAHSPIASSSMPR